LMKLPGLEILNKVERALDSVDVWLRGFIGDEMLPRRDSSLNGY